MSSTLTRSRSDTSALGKLPALKSWAMPNGACSRITRHRTFKLACHLGMTCFHGQGEVGLRFTGGLDLGVRISSLGPGCRVLGQCSPKPQA